VPPERAPVRKEITYLVVTAVIVAVIMVIHNWLGVPPWG
jgi:hypothetical protein